MTTEATRKVGWALRELSSLYEPTSLEMRAENAYGVSIRLFDLIEHMIPEPEDQRKLMAAWFKAVRDRDYRRFKKAFRRYHRSKSEPESVT